MSKKKVLTTVVIDRSGSIRRNLAEAQAAYDTYITDRQAEKDVSENLALYQFDTVVDKIFDYKKVKDIPTGEQPGAYKIIPRGWTALQDAVIGAISGVEARPEASDDKITKIIVVNTDGEENSSREHSGNTGKLRLKELVAEKQAKGWVFVWLGAGPEAIGAARDYGISYNTTMDYNPDVASVGTASASSMVTRGLNSGVYAFSAAERSASAGTPTTTWISRADHEKNHEDSTNQLIWD